MGLRKMFRGLEEDLSEFIQEYDSFIIDTNNAIARLRNDIGDLRPVDGAVFTVWLTDGLPVRCASYEDVNGFFYLFDKAGKELAAVPKDSVVQILRASK